MHLALAVGNIIRLLRVVAKYERRSDVFNASIRSISLKVVDVVVDVVVGVVVVVVDDVVVVVVVVGC